MEGHFSNRVRDVISLSRQEALRLGNDHIGTAHLLLGLLREGEGPAVDLLRTLGCNLDALTRLLEDRVRGETAGRKRDAIPLTRRAEAALRDAFQEARRAKRDVIGTEHLLLSLLHEREHLVAQILRQHFSITYEAVRAELGGPVGGEEAATPDPLASFKPWQHPSTGPPERTFQTTGRKVPVEIVGLQTAPSTDRAYGMVLRDAAGERQLVIVIGAFEAQAIEMNLEKIRTPRPMTHDLFRAFGEHFGLAVAEVCIDQIHEGTFCAYLRVRSGEQEALIDARPSDAVALAAGMGLPVYVQEAVLEAAATDA